MTLLNFFLVIINILIMIFGYLYMKKKIERLVLNKDILKDIKREINDLIVKLNETTVNDITIIEEKAKKLESLLRLSERKIRSLDGKNPPEDIIIKEFIEKPKINTYSPQIIVKQSLINTENYKEELDDLTKIPNERKLDSIDEVLNGLPLNEKVKILYEEGWNAVDIRKKLSLSEGEFDLIKNIEKINF